MRLRPLEAVNLASLVLLSALTVAFSSRLPMPGALLERYGAMGAGLVVLAWLSRREEGLPPAARAVLNFYPIAFVPILYESLGPLIPAVNPSVRDDLLIAADRALFGTDPTVWLERFVRPGLTDFLFIAYLTYYFIAIAIGIVVWLRDRPAARRFIFTLTVSYFVSYAGYFAVPALGPRVALASRQTVALETTSVSRTIAATLDELEHTKFDVFPSGHTMIAVVALIVAWKRARGAFWILLPIATALIDLDGLLPVSLRRGRPRGRVARLRHGAARGPALRRVDSCGETLNRNSPTAACRTSDRSCSGARPRVERTRG